MKQVQIIDNIEDFIIQSMERERKELKLTKKQFSLKCNVEKCENRAIWKWEPNLIVRIIRTFQCRSLSPFKPQYCNKCIDIMCKRLRLYKDEWKEITKEEKDE